MIKVKRSVLYQSIVESLENYQLAYILNKENMNRMNGINQSNLELIEESLTIAPPPLAEIEMTNYVLRMKNDPYSSSVSDVGRMGRSTDKRLKRLEKNNDIYDIG